MKTKYLSIFICSLFLAIPVTAETNAPIVSFESSAIVDNDNMEYEIKGTAKVKSEVEISISDSEDKIVEKSLNTDNGDFETSLNLSSLKDSRLTLEITATNSDGLMYSVKTYSIQKEIKQIPPVDPKVYELTDEEEKRWNIHDDGTIPKESTTGLNNAIKWASENGFKEVKVQDGTYTIAKTDKTIKDDKNNAVNMVSNMTLSLSKGATLKKETNNEQGYGIVNFGNVDNSSINGGKLIGDRDTHNYSKPKDDGLTTNTHEWGNAINTKGASNIVIDGVYIKGTTGDGLEIGAGTIGGTYLTKFEKGAIDNNGKPVDVVGKIRTTGRTETNFDNRKIYDKYDNFYMWLPQGNFKSKSFDVYFYEKDGTFLGSQKSLKFYTGEAKIPKNADYFVSVFDADSTDHLKINRMTVDLSENITFENSEIDNTRRQGISVVGSKNVNVTDSNIHDVRGVAPQSGIDIEPGFFPSTNTIIKRNKFLNNMIQIVLAYGQGAEVNDNYFEKGKNSSVGFYSYEGFTNLNADNNTFNGSGFFNNTNNSKMTGNKFLNNAGVTLNGDRQVLKDSEFTDSSLGVGGGDTQEVSNVKMTNSKVKNQSIYVDSAGKVNLKDVSLEISGDEKTATAFLGTGHKDNNYANITIKDTNQRGTALPQGKFTSSYFDVGVVNINNKGFYQIDKSEIKSNGNLLSLSGVHGLSDTTIKNSKIEQRGNTGYGASFYIQGANSFNFLNNEVDAKANTSKTTLMKFGGYGKAPANTKIFNITLKGNTIKTKQGLDFPAIDTLNAGTDAPPYRVEGNTIYNSKLKLKGNDIDLNNKVLVE